MFSQVGIVCFTPSGHWTKHQSLGALRLSRPLPGFVHSSRMSHFFNMNPRWRLSVAHAPSAASGRKDLLGRRQQERR